MKRDQKETANMADGGVAGDIPESPIVTFLRKYTLGHGGLGGADQQDMAAANSVDPSSTTAKGEEPKPESEDKMAKGGAVMDPKDVIGLPGVPPPPAAPMNPVVAAGLPGVPALPGVQPSAAEKLDLVMKALKKQPMKLDDGGVVTPGQLPVDAPQESKLQTILNALGMAGSKLANSPLAKIATTGAALATDPVSTAVDMASEAAPAIAHAEAPAINAVGKGIGTLTGQAVPQVPTPAAGPSAMDPKIANFVQQAGALGAQTGNIPDAAPKAAPSAAAHPATDQGPNPLDQLGKFDPNTVTPSMNPADRQALAASLNQNQHSYGNYLAEALAGLGDAVAAKGGVQQNSLGNIFAMQKEQRDEALANFDKARQAAVEHFTMKNQADQAIIANLRAKGELQVAPGIAKAIGHPELAGKPVAQADLVTKTDAMKYDYANKLQERKQGAFKDAADAVDKALTHGGIFGTQKAIDPQSRLRMIHQQAIKNDPEAFGYSVTGGK